MPLYECRAWWHENRANSPLGPCAPGTTDQIYIIDGEDDAHDAAYEASQRLLTRDWVMAQSHPDWVPMAEVISGPA